MIFVVDTNDPLSYQFLYRLQLVRHFYPPAAKARSAVAVISPSLLKQFSYAYLIVAGNSFCSILESGHRIWQKVKSWGLPIGVARFACRGIEPGTILVVCHDGNRVVMILQLSSRCPSQEDDGCGFPKWLTQQYSIQAVSHPFTSIGGIPVKAYCTSFCRHM